MSWLPSWLTYHHKDPVSFWTAENAYQIGCVPATYITEIDADVVEQMFLHQNAAEVPVPAEVIGITKLYEINRTTIEITGSTLFLPHSHFTKEYFRPLALLLLKLSKENDNVG